MIQALIAAGADIDATNNMQSTALHYAAALGGPMVIQELINCGANTDAKNANQRTALDMARENNDFSKIKILLKSGAHKLLLASIKNYAIENKTGKRLKEIITTYHPDTKIDTIAVINAILENYYKIRSTEPIAHPDQNQNAALLAHPEDAIAQPNAAELDNQKMINENVAIYGVASMPDKIDYAFDELDDMSAFRTTKNSPKAGSEQRKMHNINPDEEDKKPAARKYTYKGPKI